MAEKHKLTAVFRYPARSPTGRDETCSFFIGSKTSFLCLCAPHVLKVDTNDHPRLTLFRSIAPNKCSR
jgi:hypothetical protein